MKKHLFCTSLVFIIFLISTNRLIAEGPSVYIQLAADNKTEFCIGDKTVLIGKCMFDADEFSRHEWKSSSPELILEKRENMAFLEFKEKGEHKFTYYAWDEQGRKDSAAITLTVYDIPNKEVITSRPFFTRLFRKDLPKIIEAVDVNADYQYKWYKDGNIIKEATQPKYKAVEKGRYRLEITSSNGCKVYSQVIEIK